MIIIIGNRFHQEPTNEEVPESQLFKASVN